MKKDLSLVILSCDKFSDVVPGNVASLKWFWPDFDYEVIIVTDKEPAKRIENVRYIVAGEIEYSDRIKVAMSQIESDYILLTLDDYYINKNVDTDRFLKIFNVAKENNIDYVRLYTKSFRENEFFDKDLDLKKIDLSYHRYKVNLYIGIWKRESLIKMCDESLNPWKFEVSLTKKMEAIKGHCLTLDSKDLISIADVVRKGRITRDTWRYVHKNGLYDGPRKKQKFSNYLKLKLMGWYKDHTSIKHQTRTKKILSKLGFKFYSDWED